ncbi:MAG: hypothetical protein E6J43_00505 [Chloroflexi bacterium]|nr:MAG: hypothetical protein E6J43_00505 [Chloroflexota bacterium]
MLCRRLFVGVGVLVFAGLGSATGAGADDVPDNVSQHSHNAYAFGAWQFDEPNGSTGITVQVSDEFTVASHGLKFRATSVCVGIAHIDESERDDGFDFVWGCKELDKSEFDFDSRLDDAFVSTSVPVECIASGECIASPDRVHLELSWTGGDSLVVTNGVSRGEECHFHRRDEYRQDMEVRGSVSDGDTDLTRGVAGAGAMEKLYRTALVVDEPSDCS